MTSRKRPPSRRAGRPRARRTRAKKRLAHQRRTSKRRSISLSHLSKRSDAARDRALHVLAAMRRNPKLTLTRAAKLENVSYRTFKKYLGSELKKLGNRYHVTPSDRRFVYVRLPDERGNILLRKTTSSKEREQAGAFLADFNRYQRGDSTALEKWRNVRIGGFGLLTDARLIEASEPEMAEFNLYRAFNGGGA